MDDNQKPFACLVSGCDMRFVNEDHLTVHKKKHEMSLTLNSSNLLKETFVDQTPTPTKLIKNCLDVGLFQDLGLQANPFDEQFKRAAHSGPSVSSSRLNHDEHDSLNTPCVMSLLTSDVNLSVSSTTDTLESSCDIPRPSVILPEQEVIIEDTTPFVPSVGTPIGKGPMLVHDYDVQELQSKSVPMVLVKPSNDEFPAMRPVSSLNKAVVQMPVITSVGVLRQVASKTQPKPQPRRMVLVSKANSNFTSTNPVIAVATSATAPTTVIQAAPSASSSVVTTSTGSGPMIQLIVKLDGQSMPFNIPLSALATSTAAAVVPNTTNTVTVQPSTVSSSSAKEVLKGTMVAKMTRKGAPNIVHNVNPVSSNQVLLGQKTAVSVGSIVSNNPIATVQPTIRTPYSPGKRKDSDDDDPQEKRRRFLERNRAAATRCRQKKKQWVDELEKKAQELSFTNSQLQKEVAHLRNEVAHLKTMLLAHKDCPITQQLRANGQPEYISLSSFTSLTPVCTSSGSNTDINSLRTMEDVSNSNDSRVLLQTIELEDSECSLENSNDDSTVPVNSDY